jgi:hypothetical protein
LIFIIRLFFIDYFFFSLSNPQQPKHLTFRDLLAFWQCYDQLYIEQYQYDRKYSSSVIDQAVNSFGMSEYDLFLSSPPRLPSYRRFNSQNEYERLFHEFSSVTNDELDACLSTNNDSNSNNNHNNKSGKYQFFLLLKK